MAYKVYSLLFITLGLFNIVQGIAIFSENSDVICYRYVYLYQHIDCVPKKAFLKVSTASTTTEVVEEASTAEKENTKIWMEMQTNLKQYDVSEIKMDF